MDTGNLIHVRGELAEISGNYRLGLNKFHDLCQEIEPTECKRIKNLRSAPEYLYIIYSPSKLERCTYNDLQRKSESAGGAPRDAPYPSRPMPFWEVRAGIRWIHLPFDPSINPSVLLYRLVRFLAPPSGHLLGLICDQGIFHGGRQIVRFCLRLNFNLYGPIALHHWPGEHFYAIVTS